MTSKNKRNDVSVRPVGEEDLELLLAWRSNPLVFQNFREQEEPLTWEEHVNWFSSRPPDRHDYVIEFEGRRVGSVSIDEDGYVGVYIGEVSLWGEGLGSFAVEWVCDRFAEDRSLFAEVNEENTDSKRVFEKCGFTVKEQKGKWIIYEYQG